MFFNTAFDSQCPGVANIHLFLMLKAGEYEYISWKWDIYGFVFILLPAKSSSSLTGIRFLFQKLPARKKIELDMKRGKFL
jgi:hypothetical protein